MIDQFRTVYRGGTGEIVEKKSRFISTVRLVESEEEALSCLEALLPSIAGGLGFSFKLQNIRRHGQISILTL